MRSEVQDPIVTAGIEAPDFFAVGKDQHLLFIVAEGKGLDGQRLALSRRSELTRIDQYGALEGREVITDDGIAFRGQIALAVFSPFHPSPAPLRPGRNIKE